jgi:hypothetical protein
MVSEGIQNGSIFPEIFFDESFLLLLFGIFVLFCFVLESGCHYIAQAHLKLTIPLPQPPEFWDYRHVPPHQDLMGDFCCY